MGGFRSREVERKMINPLYNQKCNEGKQDTTVKTVYICGALRTIRIPKKKHVLRKPIPENKQREGNNMMIDDVELDEIAKGLADKRNHESDHDKLNRLIEEALSAMKEASELALKLKAMQIPEKKVPWYKRLFGGK